MEEPQKATCAVCNTTRPISQMRNVDTKNRDPESEWIYACNAVNPHGLGGTCYGKYNRESYLNTVQELENM